MSTTAPSQGRLSLAAAALASVVLPIGAGAGLALAVAPTLGTKTFPWVTARALGIAAYAVLAALVALGAWQRHPWRRKMRLGHAESLLRVHATLGAAAVGLVVAHVVFLATDPWAGVGWRGALLPGLSHYRGGAVALGVLSFYALVAIGVTARFAGSPGARHWRAVHGLAAPAFLMAWVHGVLAGADTAALRPFYVASGALVALVYATRAIASEPAPSADGAQARGTR